MAPRLPENGTTFSAMDSLRAGFEGVRAEGVLAVGVAGLGSVDGWGAVCVTVGWRVS